MGEVELGGFVFVLGESGVVCVGVGGGDVVGLLVG